MKRREFLGGLFAAGALLAAPVAWGDVLPQSRRLVMIHLMGGNDGLNTVIPYRDPTYRKLRPTLAVSDALPLNGELGLHPALAPLKTLFETRRLCVIPGVGYGHPSLSHFRSTEIWATASDAQSTVGWLGKVVEQGTPNPFRAVSIGNNIPLSLVGHNVVPLTVGPFDRFALPPAVRDVAPLYQVHGSPRLEAVARQGRQAMQTAGKLARLAEPRGDLMRVVSLMQADLGIEIFHVAIPGFDTHVRQADTHGTLLKRLGEDLAEYQKALESRGLADRTLTVVFSEFGRRAEENGSAGTDHGTAGPMLLLGTKVRPGVHGTQPSLTDLDDGNLRHTADFRAVYAAVLRDWLNVAPDPIVGSVTPLEVIS